MAKLSALHKEIILAYARNNMNISRVAEELHYHINTMQYRIAQIARTTGLNPKNFYDLCKLVEIARDDNAV